MRRKRREEERVGEERDRGRGMKTVPSEGQVLFQEGVWSSPLSLSLASWDNL